MLKPKTSVQNMRALHYKRYTQTEETKQENQSTSLKNILGLESNSIGKYQINKYYYNGSFDFMMRGDMEKAEVQYVKGLITPATSFEIRTFDDSIKLDHDDLVVIDGMLYAIESISVTQKRVPKKFNIYYATLTSIL